MTGDQLLWELQDLVGLTAIEELLEKQVPDAVAPAEEGIQVAWS